MIIVRRATDRDARAIHDTHMYSIQSVCSKDHSAEEIAAWGGRSFNKQKWQDAIRFHHVWVAEIESKIEGYAHLSILPGIDSIEAYVEGLYLTPKCLGKKIGLQMINLIIEKTKEHKICQMRLHSTITAHDFYQKIGFVDDGSMITVTIAGQPVRCFPMTLIL